MRRITLTLQDNEAAALQRLSRMELRQPREQAVALLRQGLARRGVLRVYGATAEDGDDDGPPEAA